MLEDLKKYDPRTEKNINKKDSFLEYLKKFYGGREMVINAFKNRIIPLADGSSSQYFKGEADTDLVGKPEKFIEFKKYLDNEVKEGFNVNFNKKDDKTININTFEVRKFVDDINSGKINNIN